MTASVTRQGDLDQMNADPGSTPPEPGRGGPERRLQRALSVIDRHLWVLVGGVLGLAVVIGFSFDRFFTWDEAVFYSQSGDYEGSGSGPLTYAPIREIGPAALVRAFRLVGLDDLPSLRMAFAATAVVTVVLAFRSVGRGVGRWPAAAGAVLFGTTLLTVSLSGRFYSALIAAVLAVWATGLYLRLRQEGPSLLVAVGFGLVLATGAWMRLLETGLVVVVLLVRSLVVRPSLVWRRRVRFALAAGGTFALTFVVPWMLDSASRYGSVRRRVDLALEMSRDATPGNRAGDYYDILRGAGLGWMEWAMPVVLVLGAVLGIALGVASARRRSVGTSHLGLVLALAAVSFSYFAFLDPKVEERYVMFAVAFGALGLGQILVAARDRWGDRLGSPVGAALGVMLVAALAMWALWGVGAARRATNLNLPDDRATERVATTIRALKGEGPCAGFVRYSQPVYALTTGCSVKVVSDAPGMTRAAAAARAGNDTVFVVWPAWKDELELSGTWRRLATDALRRNVLYVAGADR